MIWTRGLYIILLISVTCALPAQEEKTLVIAGFAVEGNKKTKEWLILRECGFQEGDSIPAGMLEETLVQVKENVTNLQLFATVNIQPVPLTGDRVLLLIQVVERWYLFPLPFIQLAEPNFNVWWKNRSESRTNYGMKLRQYNFRGRNERLAATFKLGYTREFQLAWRTPYLIKDKNWGVSVSSKFKENEEINTGSRDNEREFFRGEKANTFTQQRYTIGASNRPSIFQQHDISLFYEHVRVKDSVSILHPDYLGGGRSTLDNFGLRYGFSLSQVDRKGYPRQGHAVNAIAVKTGLRLTKNSADILDIYAEFKQYLQLSDRWHTGHSFSGRTTFYDRLPYFYQRGLGYGNSSVRSYEFYIMDGQHFLLTRNNLSFNLIPERTLPQFGFTRGIFPEVGMGVFLNVIGDLGYVQDELYSDVNPLSNELLMGTGLGIDFVTNYDIVFRAEYTVNRLGEHGFYLHYRRSI